jgi:ornithine carbamoyltransferase
MKRDFLTLTDFTLAEHQTLFARTAELKTKWKRREKETALEGRTLVLLFEKASTRTRLSFEAAIGQMGGQAITLPFSDSQMARGEPLADTARVASSYCDAIMFRTFGDERLTELAKASSVPVINGLSDGGHPVQLLADLFTIHERLGSIQGRTVAWIGDSASNMARSWCEAAKLFDFSLKIAAPVGYRPPPDLVKGAQGRVSVVERPEDAARGAHVVSTDVWASMGQEKEMAARKAAFAGFQVNDALMAVADAKAIFLHCLPAHRGEEVTASVLEGPQSAVWQEAENRLHVQKALLEKVILA